MSATIEAPSQASEDEAKAALEAEQARLDAGGELAGDGRDLPDGAADDKPSGDVDAQDGLFDQVIEDEELEALLEERETRKVAKSKATKAFKEKNDAARAVLEMKGALEEGTVVRCGRFRVKTKGTAARRVEFETAPSKRVDIKLFDDAA